MNPFIKMYCDYASEVTDAPMAFHEFVAYGILSATSQGKIYLPSQEKGLKPNLYMILLAPSSYYRKSTSLMLGINLLRKLDEDLLLPNEFSMEGLQKNLQIRPDGVFYYNEFKTLLGLLKRDYMKGGLAFLCSLYDNYPGYKRVTLDETIKIEDTFVNLWGATTQEWFVKEVSGDDIASGFLARFLFVYGGEKIKRLPFPPPIDLAKQKSLLEYLIELRKISGEVIMTTKAKEKFIEYDAKTETKAINCKHDYDCIYSRLSDYVKKFSILNAISDFRYTISEEDMDSAITIVEYATKNIEDVVVNKVGISKFAHQKKRTFEYIKKAGEAGIMRRDLITSMQIPSKELDQILDNLREEEKISSKTQKTLTKSRLMYYARIVKER